MKKICFFNKPKSYIIVAVSGILAGLLVAFFSRFPPNDLWAFALFSSNSLGFWVFSCSLIALFSEKSHVAGINVAVYVFLMFYVTGIFKRLSTVIKGYNNMAYFYQGFWQVLAYGLIPAAVCFALAFVLWFARKEKPVFIMLRFIPAVCIIAEAVWDWMNVAQRGQNLFMALVVTLCAVIYLFIILESSEFGRKRT